MCSKKCAKPVLPGSTSLREPVCTGICSDTRLGSPVGTTITLRPLASVFSRASKGRMSPAALAAAACCAGAPALGAAGVGELRWPAWVSMSSVAVQPTANARVSARVVETRALACFMWGLLRGGWASAG